MAPKAEKAAVKVRKGPRDETKVNLGQDTEAMVAESAARMARTMGIRLDKVPTPWRICGQLGQYRKCIQVARSIVDFLGHDASGRLLAIEVKSVSADPPRFLLSTLRRDRPHQAEYLEHATRCGARAYLLVDFPPLGVWYLVPWEKARGMVRISPEDEACRPFLADREMFLLPGRSA
jgi:penicillin-binding protein-related factor A (putative recombinase)